MRIIPALIIIFSSFTSFAQEKCIAITPPYDSTLAYIGDSSAHRIISRFDFSNTENEQISFYLGDISYAFVNCRSDWYKYIDGRWVNQYKLNNHGFTCSPVLFIEDGWPHLYGGYGIWRGQSLNIQMDGNGEWSANRSPSVPENYKPAIGFKQNDSTVILLGGIEVNTIRDVNNIVTKGYSISSTGEWSTVDYSMKGQPSDIGYRIAELYTNRYRVSVTIVDEVYGFYVYDQNTGDLTYSQNHWSAFGPQLFYLSGDSLVVSSGRFIQFHIPDLIEEGESVLIGSTTSSLNFNWLWSLLLIPVAWFVRKAKKVSKQPASTPRFYNELLSKRGNSYTGDQLNEIFGIDHLSYDQVRKRRSAILQSINDFHFRHEGKQLISRVRDQADKRHIIYQVD